MWCEPKKNGTVVYRERYKDPLTEKTKIVSVTKPKDTPQNRNKAHRELSAKIEVLIQATQSKNVSVTLSQLQSEYLKAQALVFKQSTVKSNYYYMKHPHPISTPTPTITINTAVPYINRFARRISFGSICLITSPIVGFSYSFPK